MEATKSAPPFSRAQSEALSEQLPRPGLQQRVPSPPRSEPWHGLPRGTASEAGDSVATAHGTARNSFETASTGHLPPPLEQQYFSDGSLGSDRGVLAEPVLTGAGVQGVKTHAVCTCPAGLALARLFPDCAWDLKGVLLAARRRPRVLREGEADGGRGQAEPAPAHRAA